MNEDTKEIIEHLETLDCPPLQLQVMQRQTQVHDLSRRAWGNSYEITRIINGGRRLRLTVWTVNDIREGDYLILKNGMGTTRYQVDEIQNMIDPPDQKFIIASFAPREAPAE